MTHIKWKIFDLIFKLVDETVIQESLDTTDIFILNIKEIKFYDRN